jgi:hypothetical protein
MRVFVAAYNRFGEYKAKHQALAVHKKQSESRLHKFAELPRGLVSFFVAANAICPLPIIDVT